jgi:predicted anti-sigma-YlaC factor YlaD
MTCARARFWMQLYLDGMLDARRLARLEEHLAGCAVCREELAVLEMVCQGTVEATLAGPAVDVTGAVMARIAGLEERRAAAGAARGFALAWADAVLAAVLATLATALFLVFQPTLWRMSSTAASQELGALGHDIADQLATWSPWVAWVVCVGLGIALTIWFAGGEVRSGWRKALMARLPH